MSLEQRIMRVVHGQPIPQNWRLVQFLGVETDLIYGPTFKADIVLVERTPSPALEESSADGERD